MIALELPAAGAIEAPRLVPRLLADLAGDV